MLQYIAHAGESHATPAENTTHFLQSWYIALPLFILAIAGFAAIVFLLSNRSKPATYLAVAGLLLVCGIATYNFSPIISISSLAIGLAMMLVMVLLSLMPNDKKR